MNIRKKAIRGIKWSAIGEVAGKGIDFALIVVLARLLDPEDFGLVAIATAFIGFATPVVTLGFPTAIVQRQLLEDEHLDVAFWFSVVLSTGLLLATIGLAGIIAGAYDQPDLQNILAWLSISFIFLSLSSVQQALLRRRLNFRLLTIRSLSAEVVGGVAAIAMAFHGLGVWSLVARQLISSLTSVLLLWAVCDWRPRLRFSKAHFRDLFDFVKHMVGSSFLVSAHRRSDNLIIGFFLGPAALGYYTMAYRLFHVVLTLVGSTTSKVGMPVLARLQTDAQRFRRVFYTMTELTAVFALPAFLGLAVLAPEIVPILFGEKWLPSVIIVQILALVGIVKSLIRPVSVALLSAGRPDLRFKMLAIDALFTIPAFIIGAQWGIVGVAVAYAAAQWMISPLWFWVSKGAVDVSVSGYLRHVSPIALSALVCAFCVAGTRALFGGAHGHMLPLVGEVLVGAFSFIIAMAWLAPKPTRQVINVFKEFFKGGKKGSS